MVEPLRQQPRPRGLDGGQHPRLADLVPIRPLAKVHPVRRAVLLIELGNLKDPVGRDPLALLEEGGRCHGCGSHIFLFFSLFSFCYKIDEGSRGVMRRLLLNRFKLRDLDEF